MYVHYGVRLQTHYSQGNTSTFTISTTRAAVKEYVASPLSIEHRMFADKLRTVSSACPKTPAAPYLFSVSPESPLPHDRVKIIFHSAVAKLMIISNRKRQDILTTLSCH